MACHNVHVRLRDHFQVKSPWCKLAICKHNTTNPLTRPSLSRTTTDVPSTLSLFRHYMNHVQTLGMLLNEGDRNISALVMFNTIPLMLWRRFRISKNQSILARPILAKQYEVSQREWSHRHRRRQPPDTRQPPASHPPDTRRRTDPLSAPRTAVGR